MSHYEKHPEWQLWLRSMLPSAGSVVGSFVFVIMVIGLHLILLSNDPELLVPHLTGIAVNDQLASTYASAIQQPLDRAFGNDTFGVLSSVVVWGFVGWAIYSLADFAFAAIRDVQRSRRDINVPLKNEVIEHPLHRQIVIRLLWRFTMGVILIVVSIALQPYISGLFERDVALLRSESAIEMLRHAGIAIVGWIAVLHLYVVLFRLFVLRTRVFGEIIY